jgi:hypothetical protein
MMLLRRLAMYSQWCTGSKYLEYISRIRNTEMGIVRQYQKYRNEVTQYAIIKQADCKHCTI